MHQANVAVAGLATLTGQPGGSTGSKCSTNDDLAPCYVPDQDGDTEQWEVRSVRNHMMSLTAKVKVNEFLGLSEQ